MRETNASEKWIEAGYELFAKEGPEGIQVERLARIVKLNKSGFYHYFGDMERYSSRLVEHHYWLFDIFLDDVATCRNIDPDYVNVLIKHKIMVMAQIQLVRNKSNPYYHGAHKLPDLKIGHAVLPIWARHINIPNNAELAFQYHSLVRDVFYARVNLDNFNYNYLRELSNESKEIIAKILRERNTGAVTV